MKNKTILISATFLISGLIGILCFVVMHITQNTYYSDARNQFFAFLNHYDIKWIFILCVALFLLGFIPMFFNLLKALITFFKSKK